MSDFGAVITVTKDKFFSNFEQSEVDDLTMKLEEIIDSDDNYINFLADPYKSTFYALDSAQGELIVQLSEYYYGEDEEEDKELFATIRDEETEDAEDLAGKLSKIYPTYTLKGEVIEFDN
jgi:hypothetical protein